MLFCYFDISMFRYFDVSIWRLNGEDEVVPVLGAALRAEHLMIEPAARRCHAFLRVGRQGGDVLGLDAHLDEQADVVVLLLRPSFRYSLTRR